MICSAPEMTAVSNPKRKPPSEAIKAYFQTFFIFKFLIIYRIKFYVSNHSITNIHLIHRSNFEWYNHSRLYLLKKQIMCIGNTATQDNTAWIKWDYIRLDKFNQGVS